MANIRDKINDTYQSARVYASFVSETLNDVLTHEISAKDGLAALIAGMTILSIGCVDNHNANEQAVNTVNNTYEVEQTYEEVKEPKKTDPKEYADALNGDCTLARFTFDSDKYIVLCGKHGIPSHLIAVSYGLSKFYDKWELQDDNGGKFVFGSNPIASHLADEMDNDGDSIITQSESNNFLH